MDKTIDINGVTVEKGVYLRTIATIGITLKHCSHLPYENPYTMLKNTKIHHIQPILKSNETGIGEKSSKQIKVKVICQTCSEECIVLLNGTKDTIKMSPSSLQVIHMRYGSDDKSRIHGEVVAISELESDWIKSYNVKREKLSQSIAKYDLKSYE